MKRAFACLLLAAHGWATAGPLGLDFGMPLSSMANLKLKSHKPYMYITSSLPRGHADFDEYMLVITPKHGLCTISGWISKVPTNSYGNGLREKFDQFREALTARYGQPQVFDFLQSGSIWREPREFMTALRKEERTLVAYWTTKKLTLPDNISGIQLKALAFSDAFGAISVTYDGNRECMDWIAQQRDSTL